MNRSLIHLCLIALVGVLALSQVFSAAAWGAGTPAGTVITNQAFGNYADANGNARPQAQSNVVSTTVAQVAAVDFSPANAAQNVALGTKVNYAFTVTNNGNGTDTFDLNVTGLPAGWTGVLYKDLNNNGILDPDEAVPGNVVNTTGSLAADAVFYGILQVMPPAVANNGDQGAATVTATSTFNNTVSDSGVFTSTVNAAALQANKTSDNPTPIPGGIITYTVTVTNNGSEPAYDVAIADAIPPNASYVAGSIRYTTAGNPYGTATPQTDAGGDDFGEFSANTVALNPGNLGPGVTLILYFRVQVNANVPEGTEITNTATINYKNAGGQEQPEVITPPTTSTVQQVAAVDVAVVGPDAQSGDPGDQVPYRVDVTNLGNGNDRYNLTFASSGGFPNQTWVDANNDGIPGNDGDYLLADTNGDGIPDTGLLGQFQVIHLIVIVTVPVGSADLAQDNTVVTGRSVFDPNVTDAVTLTTTVTAPDLALLKSVSPQGEVPPGGVLTYTVVITNNGTGNATSVVIIDQSPNNTTYVLGSVKVNNVAKTDATDVDEAQVADGQVQISLGMMPPGASHTIMFQCTVN